jgi:hypothetical protein
VAALSLLSFVLLGLFLYRLPIGFTSRANDASTALDALLLESRKNVNE